MRVNIAQSHPPPSTSSPLSPHSSQNALPSSLRLHRSSSSSSVLSLSKTHNHLRRSCSATFDGQDFPNDHFTPKLKPPTSSITTSFLHHADVLEPSYLGIRTDPPDWPASDEIMRDCVARRANCIDIPLSLRMIKMKQKFLKLEEQRDVHFGDSNSNHNSDINNDNSLNNLCYSTLHIIREIQSYAFKSRGIALNEELDDVIISKVQREMSSSFVWLIKEVFAKTPDLMLQIMLITSNFALFSLQSFSHVENEKKDAILGGNLGNLGVGHLELGNLGVPTREILENMVDTDVGLWKSMVDEAVQLRGDLVIDQGLRFVVDRDRDDGDYNGSVEEIEGSLEQKKFEIVSPVKVEIEKDDYEEYHRTDLLYQSGLFKEPNNTLLLSNYSQFLCLVSRDYDRAEECLKRAIQLDPSDAEIVSQYANFLWIIRNDLWGAEERFQQAMAAEPDNSYHASKYANFLWNTGGDETCYPIDDDDTPQESS